MAEDSNAPGEVQPPKRERVTPVDFCERCIIRLHRSLDDTIRALMKIEKSVALTAAVIDLHCQNENREMTDGEKCYLEQVKADAEFAAEQRASDFGLLRAHTAVGIWGVIETFIDDFIVWALLRQPEARQVDKLAKVKVPLAEFEALDNEDRMRLLLGELKRSLSTETSRRLVRPNCGRARPGLFSSLFRRVLKQRCTWGIYKAWLIASRCESNPAARPRVS